MKKKTIYIAGKMRGIRYYNFPLFFQWEKHYQDMGWNVINPARIDMEKDGFDPLELDEDHDWSQETTTMDLNAIIDRDIEAVRKSDAIHMIEDGCKQWMTSTGARAELALATWQGSEIYYG